MPSLRLIAAIGLLATGFAMPCRAAEKLPAVPKLVHRQIGAGFTLALEAARRDKTFFLCRPGKTDCISTKAVGWREPFIIILDGAVISPGFNVLNTESKKYRHHSELPSDLKKVSLYPAAVAWEKLSPTKPVW